MGELGAEKSSKVDNSTKGLEHNWGSVENRVAARPERVGETRQCRAARRAPVLIHKTFCDGAL